ncbi:unnamed protein product [Gadus morhua 'NCC']
MFSEKGSRDNMSVVLVSLPGAPKVTEEALKKEEDLDKYLESRVEELLGRFGDEGVPDLVSVLRRSVIEAMYNRLNLYREEEGVSSSV